MMQSRFFVSVSIGLILISGCGSGAEQPDIGAPTSVEGVSPTVVSPSVGGQDVGSAVFHGQELAPGPKEVLADGATGWVSYRSADYELISLRRDGWDVQARVRGPQGIRDVRYAFRIDGERCLYTGEVRDGAEVVWKQSFDAAVDGSLLRVEESDGVDLLRFEVLAGDREDYTLVLGDGDVRHYSAPLGAEDPEGWAAFWPSATGLDWNPDAALCNGLAKGRILRDEVDAALASTISVGDPQYLHPLLEQVCHVLQICATMKCRSGGGANQLCLDCLAGVGACELMRLIFG